MNPAIWLLRLGPSLIMIVFGIHQVFIDQRPWFEYVPKFLQRMFNPTWFMRIHGTGNILLGLFLISGLYPLIAAWVALVWWASILVGAFSGGWKTGMRDLTITISLIALVYLLSH
jgi:hypothetical protein